jgi:hypothetical protein
MRHEVRTNEAPGHSVLEVVLLGKQRHDAGVDGAARELALRVLGHNAGPHLNLLAHLQAQRIPRYYTFHSCPCM